MNMSEIMPILVPVFVILFFVFLFKLGKDYRKSKLEGKTKEEIKTFEEKKEKRKNYIRYALIIICDIFFGYVMVIKGFDLLSIIFLLIVMTIGLWFVLFIQWNLFLKLIFEDKLDEREKQIARKSARNTLILILLAGLVLTAINRYYPGLMNVDNVLDLIWMVIGFGWIGFYVYYTKIKPPKES